jgi:hypothetical protein
VALARVESALRAASIGTLIAHEKSKARTGFAVQAFCSIRFL